MANVIHLWGGPWEARMRLPHNPPPSPIPLGGAEIIYVTFPQHRIIEERRNAA